MALCIGLDLISFAAVALLGAWFFARRFGLTSAQRREMVILFTLAGTLMHFVILALLWLPAAFLTID